MIYRLTSHTLGKYLTNVLPKVKNIKGIATRRGAS